GERAADGRGCREGRLHATVLQHRTEPPVVEIASDRATPLVPLDEERAVVERLQRGDRTAVATLYGWYGDPIWRLLLARVGERDLAEDCLRETFRVALEKIGQFSYDGQSVFPWLRRIAVNKAMDVHR